MDVTALGIDIGSTNTKVVAVALSEAADAITVLAAESAPTPGDAAGLLAAVGSMVRTVTDRSGMPACVGIASMAESGVALGADGDALTEILRWDGQRGSAAVEQLARRLPPRELFARTGVRLSGKAPIATLAWLANSRPEAFAALRQWAGVADLIAKALTGRLVTDHTLAARTGLYRLPVEAPAAAGGPVDEILRPAATFDAELLGLVGLRQDQLPRVLGPDDAQPVTASGGFSGLAAGIPVTVAGHDHAVGAYLAGARAAGDVVDSLGTAEAVIALAAGRPDADRAFDAGFGIVPSVTGRQLAVLGGSPGAGAMVQWWREAVLAGLTADDLFAQANALLPEVSAYTVLPYLRGRQCPAPSRNAKVAVLPTMPTRHGELVDATLGLFEGLAYQARWMLDTSAELAGIAPSKVTVVGGPARAAHPWLPLKAAVTPVSLLRVTLAHPVAVGAAVIAAQRSGLIDDAPAAASTPVAPVPRDHEGRYRAFVATALAQTPAEAETEEKSTNP